MQAQTDYEKKLHLQTIEVLENKISELIAENTELKGKNVRFELTVKDYKQQIESITKDIKQSRTKVANSKIKSVVESIKANKLNF